MDDLYWILDNVWFPEYTFKTDQDEHVVNQRPRDVDRGDLNYEDMSLVAQEGVDYSLDWKGDVCRYDDGTLISNPLAVDECLEDIARLLHFRKIIENLKKEGREVDLPPEAIKIVKKYIKREKKSVSIQGLTFYTIVPKERLPFNEGEIVKIREFCKIVFNKKKLLKCAWVVEVGKHKENPNLHIHAVCKLIDKNFKRYAVAQWKKMYPDYKYRIDWIDKKRNACGWKMIPCNTLPIQEDKLKYLKNNYKGSHENFIDLKVGDQFGNWVDSTTTH